MPSFSASAFAADAQSPGASPQRQHEVCVRPHALEEHVPGLLGPLATSSCAPDDSDDSDADLDDNACSLLALG